MIRVLLAATLVAGCGGSATPPADTPEPTESLEDQVRSYIDTYGGNESQYRIILGQANCDELANLFEGAMGRQETEVEGSPEWREALGYANAINSRQLDLDC